MGRHRKEQAETAYRQPGFEVQPPSETQEVTFDNCLVLATPSFTETQEKKQKRQDWTCPVLAQPSLWQPETQEQVYLASARNALALAARRSSIKPGDRLALTGTLRTDTMTAGNGETVTETRLLLSQAPAVIIREERVSTTVFEQRQHR